MAFGRRLAPRPSDLWDVDEAERFAKLALGYPHLLTHEEQVRWKLWFARLAISSARQSRSRRQARMALDGRTSLLRDRCASTVCDSNWELFLRGRFNDTRETGRATCLSLREDPAKAPPTVSQPHPEAVERPAFDDSDDRIPF
jgi:hypothetical protein